MMKTNMKRMIALLLSIILLLSSYIPTFATDSSEVLEYSSTYNSGERDEICYTLDGTSADEYYTGDYTYDDFYVMTGDELYSALHSLMTTTHTKISSYDDCHYKADKTDCENEDGRVLLIYTSYSATMSQWNGWNREHVWPQSLGGNNTRGGGADLHHVRPSDASANSSRGNKKYGNVEGGKDVKGNNPAVGYIAGTSDGTFFEPNDNVKGDVARIILYVWVRWGNDWGASSVTEVFQSVDVLLEWCEMDPVDTWEMGRNEVVQNIQGNRNVFIDYPELAWLIFDREVPSDMDTPSGEASGGVRCTHADNDLFDDKAATCTEDGYTGDKFCYDCDKIVKRGKVIPATNHQNSELRNAVSAGCNTEGYSGDKFCFDCNEVVLVGQVLPATGVHTYGEWSGSTRTCIHCGAVEVMPTDSIIDEIGSDAEKILLLLALGIGDSLILDSISN